jgi:hypothetical protein
VGDLGLALVEKDHIGDDNPQPTRGPQVAGIIRLTTRCGVKHRAVEHDALLVHRDDARLALTQVAVVAKQAGRWHDALNSFRAAA